MPPANKMPLGEAVNIILDFYDDLNVAKLPPISHEIWTKLEQKSNHRWKALTWRISIMNDRRGIFSKATDIIKNKTTCTNPMVNKRQIISIEPETDDTRDKNDGSESTSECDSDLDHGESWVDLVLSWDDWLEIRDKKYNILQAGLWTNFINDKFYDQHKYPCAFSFKRGQLYKSTQIHFLKISGYCVSKNCGNRFYGIADHEPTDQDEKLVIKVATRNTRTLPHSPCRRRLNGNKRIAIGEAAIAEGSLEVERRICREKLKFGDKKAPIVPSLNSIRHAKRAVTQKKLGVEREAHESVYQNIH